MNFQELPPAFFRQVNAELAGEKILWAGRPDARKAFLFATPMLLFAIPWTVFAIGWEYIALAVFFSKNSHTPSGPMDMMAWVFPIFGLPFVLVGLYMTAAPFWAWWKARNTVYALTEQRMVTVISGRNLNVKSIDVSGIASIDRAEKRNGSGTLHLNMGVYRDSEGDKIEKRTTLEGVPDVRELELLMIARSRRLRQDNRTQETSAT
jgi:hypothetical protein